VKNKLVALHLHFDLPPCDDPWLERVDADPSALPFRDAHERFYHTVVGPLLEASLRDEDGRPRASANVLERVSFSFAPSLLAWLEREQPRAYALVLAADRSARRRGRGGALACPHPSLILPLASPEERRAALAWGLADFRRRFRREPEACWLPEGAADAGTLELLAETGLRFALLDPSLLEKVRPIGGRAWQLVDGARFEPRRPYRWSGGGKTLTVLFRDARLSASAASGRLAAGGARALARRLVDGFRVNDASETMLVAAPAEAFSGDRGGERALAEALDLLARETAFAFASPSRALDLFPPPEEAALRLPGASACAHGLARWGGPGVCPCPGALAPHSRRSLSWRPALREALAAFASDLDRALAPSSAALFADPAAARAAWLDEGPAPDARAVQRHLDAHTRAHASPEEARRALRLLEAWRMRLEAFSFWTWESPTPAEGPALRALRCAARAALLSERETGDEGPRTRLAAALRALPGSAERGGPAGTFEREFREQSEGPRRWAAHAATLEHLTGALGFPRALPESSVYDLETEVLLRRTAEGRRGELRSVSVLRLRLRDRRLRENTRCFAAVTHAGRLALDVRLREGFAPRDAEAAAALANAFLEADGSDYEALASNVFGPGRLGIDALLSGERRRAVLELSPPAGGRGRALGAWTAALRASLGGGDPLELLRAAAEAARCGVGADALPDAAHARALVLRAAEDLSREPSVPRADALLGLLRAAGEAGLSLPLRALQARALEGLQGVGPSGDALAAELGLSRSALMKEPL
jgi:hypothetical protein